MLKAIGIAVSVGLAGLASASDNEIKISGGQTSVLLNTDALSDLASLDLSGVSDAVIVPGDIEGSVAFPINPRSEGGGLLPTTFGYNLGDFLGSFFGTIEHEGSVFFNNDHVEVGNFTIGFDAHRITENASGFFVESTVGIPAILFDVANPSGLNAGGGSLVIEADLLVSPEFAGFLQDNGLAHIDLTGADVGDARVNGDAGCSGADVTDNGRVNGRDFWGYVISYIAGKDSADFDGDGLRTPSDFTAFLHRLIACVGH